ncbi:Tropomyosin, putative [Perkinsus marinus ATCC 50983]|uniref:Tropomyosin, putative n=1 Tax=Perkinsus marinus (strain ATCC 50983 / TXsc) TaxID=423536 RepID=C5LGL4_PERM5|nr:Tropomyosin, putative [Perkinsus marinus ATCC 50983]EER04133.1 Tropomyosin, putative [Perkinsus marinus ATCC 50983]|eukprot:XP_002772317.1 Tropomyosin, putative [Perkinsus marinus ATCC 50983]
MSSGKEAGASGDDGDDGRLQLQRSVLEADMRTLEEMKTANAAEEAEVKAAREAVEDAIKEVTGPIDEERQQVDKQRLEVEERIRKLQEELAQLKTTRDECNEKLSRLDGDIVAARGKFQHELDNVEVAEEKFDKKTKAMVLKEELIEQQRKAIEQREDEIHQRRAEDLENRRALEEELDALDTSHKVTDRWLASCDKLESAVEGSVGVIVEGAELRASLRRQVTDVAEQLSTLDLEIGRIEEEKQQAVRSRRFGEAKNLSAEGKTVEESIATTEESIGKLRDRSTALRQQLDEAQSKEDGLLDGSTDVTGCGDVLDEMAFSVKARLHYVGEVAEGEGLKPEAEMLEALDAEIAKHLPSEAGEKLRVQMAALVNSDTRAVSPQDGDTAK